MLKLASLTPCIALLALAACQGRRELREWQPSDHQPPPAVAPEGQGEAADDSPGSASPAAALWGARCASCHGLEGRGDGPQRPPGSQIPNLASAAYQSTRSDIELHTIVKQGRGMMPAFGTELSDEIITQLVKHVRTLAR